MATVITGIIAVLFVMALSFLLVAGLVYLVCLGFGFAFSWFLALGVWALMVLLKSIFSATIKVSK